MLFNSINFLIFLPIVFFLYWFVAAKKLALQNILLLVSSYFFYACWDYRFLFLLIFSTLLDYLTGIKIYESDSLRLRRFWFWLSVSVNLGLLCVFKYFNFFISSFTESLSQLGIASSPWIINVILPIGISFYTFHGLSYVIDIYYKRIVPEYNFVNYSVFVSFFPLLVAGPIERATHLLPQIQKERRFYYPMAVDGLRQILWGLFKKVVIADNCAPYVNMIFDVESNYSGSVYLLGAILFAVQIYCDFSGYSDMALGVAKLFGINLLRNFAFPYFSRDIAEFWRRWHISLSSWFRDYLYIPLGGSKGGTLMKVRNTIIIFVVSGLWHGANWTFIFWGFLNALYFLPLLLLKRNRNYTNTVAEGRLFPSLREAFEICITFFLTLIAWVFFRATSMGHAFSYLNKMFSKSLLQVPEVFPVMVIALILIFISIEWLQRDKQHALELTNIKLPTGVRWGLYTTLVAIIILFGASQQEFIYFQF